MSNPSVYAKWYEWNKIVQREDKEMIKRKKVIIKESRNGEKVGKKKKERRRYEKVKRRWEGEEKKR